MPLFTCCGPLLILACFTKDTGRGFLISASASRVDRHCACALSASRMYVSAALMYSPAFMADRRARLVKMVCNVIACEYSMADLVRGWMATQQADNLDAVAIRRERDAMESRCRTMLHTGLYQFKSRLDITPFDVLQEAVIPHSIYNYLVPKASRRNRLQFATNWPSLLPHVSGTPARGSI